MTEVIVTTRTQLEEIIKKFLLAPTPLQVDLPDQEQAMNQKQAAEYLGITQSTLIRWKKQGKIPYQQLQGSSKVRYFRSQLRAALARNQ